ncbi:hypothetical protein LTR99_007478 [Exophiala xenobiotica]|uniref:Ethyl tert-butyl ether degradation EthD n=1 Tax=Vermiconidia calcicola TaxID=1690605 RepID=A0AAV9Q3M4_9PEZI|nr:hypothetical protein LTR99_007478 [Exophiala xenobiotica]KAK5534587.1 hypothetical protein LTR25_006619 [Vermiconidia calcicola]KAK5544532.1 hypothetical protein LTR23_004296 [Chaetothyriales sp. CCFEE 6169]KAK5317735.1 hypothetical protein LTR93_008376 [Exophiala xenobiotica]KAK5388216.1 hypothetical protein LTS13_001152 [Exophiala xenobiotica]
MTQGCSAMVVYPAGADAKFDMAYYLKKHMPLVAEHWTKFGLNDWKVVDLGDSPDGSKPYSVAAILTWDSVDGVKKALADESAKIVMGDVENFSNKSPTFLMGDIVGSSMSRSWLSSFQETQE